MKFNWLNLIIIVVLQTITYYAFRSVGAPWWVIWSIVFIVGAITATVRPWLRP